MGTTIANKEQFNALEELFNNFYKWYVPKRVISNKMKKSSTVKLVKKPDDLGENEFAQQLNKILNEHSDPFL